MIMGSFLHELLKILPQPKFFFMANVLLYFLWDQNNQDLLIFVLFGNGFKEKAFLKIEEYYLLISISLLTKLACLWVHTHTHTHAGGPRLTPYT